MNNLQSIEFWLVVLLGTICVVCGFGVFARWCAFGPAVRRDQLERLRVGMTSAEVVTLLGEPRDHRWATQNKNLTWTYGAPMKRHVLILEFSAHDVLLSFAHGVPGENRRQNPFPDA
jgi:hypothetical protein